MNRVLTGQLSEVVASPDAGSGLRCESQLRVAATMLGRAHADEMSAATLVGTLGMDDVAAFEELVAEIANEFDLDARVRLHIGSFAVRFTRAAEARRT